MSRSFGFPVLENVFFPPPKLLHILKPAVPSWYGVCGGVLVTLLRDVFAGRKITAMSVFQAKQKVDAYHLQLQNLLYEVMHLQKEITKCLEFK